MKIRAVVGRFKGASIKKPSRHLGHLFLILLFYLGWSAKNVVIKVTLSDIDSLHLTLALSIVVVLSSLPIVFFQNNRKKRHIWGWFRDRSIAVKLVSIGLTTTIALYTAVVSIDLIGPFAYSVTEVITYAMWLSALSFIFLGDRLSKSIAQAMIISIIGFIVFSVGNKSTSGSLQITGIGIALISSLFWAGSIILIKQLLTEGISPEELVAIRFMPLAIIAIIVLPGDLEALTLPVVIKVLLIGIFGYTAMFMLLFYGLKDVSATIVGVFNASGPLFTALFAWLLIPGTKYTGMQMLGLAIIMFGLVYAIVREGNDTIADEPT
jgi:drug/metabolite transporter (DMT)-like permease